MNTLRQCLAQSASRLALQLGLDAAAARLESRVLMEHALDVSRAWLIAHELDLLDNGQIERHEALLRRRLHGEPIAYITGVREFYGRNFCVTPDVLIPRPETELLVELALARADRDVHRILDLGTGSGCIAISLALENPRAEVCAVEISAAALNVARQNAQLNGAQVECILGRWFAELGQRKFDTIVANPPYVAPDDVHLGQGDVRFEPAGALIADCEGLAELATIIRGARQHLAHGGCLLLEHGYDQAQRVRDLLGNAGFTQVQTWRDLAGLERVTGGCVDLSE